MGHVTPPINSARTILPRKRKSRAGKAQDIGLRSLCRRITDIWESSGRRSEDLTGVMALARDITGYASPPPYDHKINVWGGTGRGQTWQRINTYITAIKLLLRPIKLQFQ